MNLRSKIGRRVRLTAALVCAIALGLAFYFSPSHEPAYQGKSLSEWIVPFCRQTATGIDAPGGSAHFEELQPVRRAVSAIGTNALPLLTARLERRESALHQTLRLFFDKHPFGSIRLEDPAIKKIRSARALAILGPAAQSAIPSLVAQLTNRPVCPHAVYALQAAGPEGLRALVDQLTNHDMVVRMQIAVALITSSFQGSAGSDETAGHSTTNNPATKIIASGLVRIAQDSAASMRMTALARIGSLGPEAGDTVPALIPLLDDRSPLVRHRAINALGSIHAHPELVVPALTNRLSDFDMASRMAALTVLRSFGEGTAAAPPPGSVLTARPPWQHVAPSSFPDHRATNFMRLPQRPSPDPPPGSN